MAVADYINLCCRSGGSNLNAGTRRGGTTEPGTAADLSYDLGNWNPYTFTAPAGRNPASDGVVAGDWGSVYIGSPSAAGFIAKVSSVSSTAINFDSTSYLGTVPSSNTGNAHVRIGGALAGPTGSTLFPTNLSPVGNIYRINLKNDKSYGMSAALAPQVSVHLWGYQTSYGDKGRASISSSATTQGITVASSGGFITDLIFTMTAGTGFGSGVTTGGASAVVQRTAVIGARGHGFTSTGSCNFVECEAYGFNASNTAGFAGFNMTYAGMRAVRCMAHGGGTGGSGFILGAANCSIERCVSWDNALHGCLLNNIAGSVSHCDFYNNGGDGANVGGATVGVVIENSNFLKNGGYGIYYPAASPVSYLLIGNNCAFGQGTMANTSGTDNGIISIMMADSVLYASGITPWVDPTTGDFRIALAAAQGTGRGAFVEEGGGKSGTVGYPDIGAAQHLAAAAGGFIIGS